MQRRGGGDAPDDAVKAFLCDRAVAEVEGTCLDDDARACTCCSCARSVACNCCKFAAQAACCPLACASCCCCCGAVRPCTGAIDYWSDGYGRLPPDGQRAAKCFEAVGACSMPLLCCGLCCGLCGLLGPVSVGLMMARTR